ncbi:NADAR family protein [Micromonospora sp. CB01531]|uniref:NADAR family protein n=1 Tax=Micromonospora sp. CB01531 TaxID=1718947 RepID=UPI00093C040C|nr:NADAR family protein [Micromonospora sp. CB01531]
MNHHKVIINSFTGEYSFLSNFYQRSFVLWGIEFPTAEHAFQAGKTLDMDERRLIAAVLTPGFAKSMGRQVLLRPYWNEFYRYEVMEEVLQAKFSDPDLLARLEATAPSLLIEGNTWGDQTWGVSRGQGHNLLGWMLMRIRDDVATG